MHTKEWKEMERKDRKPITIKRWGQIIKWIPHPSALNMQTNWQTFIGKKRIAVVSNTNNSLGIRFPECTVFLQLQPPTDRKTEKHKNLFFSFLHYFAYDSIGSLSVVASIIIMLFFFFVVASNRVNIVVSQIQFGILYYVTFCVTPNRR